MCNDFADIQDILESKNKDIDVLRHDISNMLEDNDTLKREKNRLEMNVNYK